MVGDNPTSWELQIAEFLRGDAAVAPIHLGGANAGATYSQVRNAIDEMGLTDMLRASLDVDAIYLVRQPIPNVFMYESVEAVHTSWGEVYVYGDDEILDVISAHEVEPPGIASSIDDYAIDARALRIFELNGDYKEDVLPDLFTDIPENLLTAAVIDLEKWSAPSA